MCFLSSSKSWCTMQYSTAYSHRRVGGYNNSTWASRKLWTALMYGASYAVITLFIYWFLTGYKICVHLYKFYYYHSIFCTQILQYKQQQKLISIPYLYLKWKLSISHMIRVVCNETSSHSDWLGKNKLTQMFLEALMDVCRLFSWQNNDS